MANRTCSLDGCEKAHRARGWCSTHYEQWRSTGSAPTVHPKAPPRCSVPACNKPHQAQGLCERHYRNARHYGHVIPMKERPLLVRLADVGWSVTAGDCWQWLGRTNDYGYGMYNHVRVHRLMFEAHAGPIPDGLIVRHKCDNPPCVNPRHLELGTHGDNAQDKVERRRHPAYGRTKCKKGHDLTLAGAIKRGTVSGCAECDRIRKRTWEKARRAS